MPQPFKLAHLSDLHLGSGEQAEQGVKALLAAVEAERVDHVLVTGDITNRGRLDEARRFEQLFAGLLLRGRATVIPGNHDRMGDDVGPRLMAGARVQAMRLPGLYLLLVDSTGPHNRALHLGHGELGAADLLAIDRALAAAPPHLPRAVALHHHLLPLPGDDVADVVTGLLGLPWCAELRMGAALLELLAGRCDLVLHGHRHRPSEHHIATPSKRQLHIYNAGRSPQLKRFRVFTLGETQGGLRPAWIDAAGVPLLRAS